MNVQTAPMPRCCQDGKQTCEPPRLEHDSLLMTAPLRIDAENRRPREVMRSRDITITVDLDRIRSSAVEIRRRTGVPLIAVIKADAYGLGAPQVAAAIADIADDFAYFTPDEARAVGRPGLIMGPPTGDPAEYREFGLRPTITTREQAQRFRGLRLAINADTGMQREGCPLEEVDELLAYAGSDELYTHAVGVSSAKILRDFRGNRPLKLHAASTSLLDCPEAWLDAVRPGYALYRGALRVTGRLVHVRRTTGPVGYSRFEYPYIGILNCGYAYGMQPAPVLINGRPQHILEVGMNTCLISVDPRDQAGDEVVLVGDDLTAEALAVELKVRPHEILCRYSGLGDRVYLGL